jgi:hypothetical protein
VLWRGAVELILASLGQASLLTLKPAPIGLGSPDPYIFMIFVGCEACLALVRTANGTCIVRASDFAVALWRGEKSPLHLFGLTLLLDRLPEILEVLGEFFAVGFACQILLHHGSHRRPALWWVERVHPLERPALLHVAEDLA